MKYVTLIATLLLSGCFTHIPTPTPPPPGPVIIQVINQSGVVSEAEFQAGVAGVNLQMTTDFQAAWGLPTVVTTSVTAGSWKVYVKDVTDQPGTLGYHNPGTPPVAFVFAQDAMNDGLTWTGTLSHEVLEMRVDPQVDQVAGGLIKEIGDPVEFHFYVTPNGVTVSDFVFPSWFDPKGVAPFDQMRVARTPLQYAQSARELRIIKTIDNNLRPLGGLFAKLAGC
jgi:hypothetical protein